MRTVNIRKAEQKDTAAILVLMKQLIDQHAALDKYYKTFAQHRSLKSYVANAIKNSDQLPLVAEINDKVVGYFLAEIQEAPYYSSEKFIGVVADAAVDYKYRRRGILTELFKEAMARFKEKGVNYLELWVDARNAPAVAAWRKLGFKDYKLRLRRTL